MPLTRDAQSLFIKLEFTTFSRCG